MDDNIAIKAEGVSKTFKLPHEKQSSIKSTILNFWRHDRTYEKLHVLEDISFEVKKGEFFGIVGRNGSGKSTLLKLLAGIYALDKGTIQVNGKLTPFIELGVGFNPELTGRENVFLNGALLGFNRKEMQAMYKDIVDFAGLKRFMDQKLKNYSSGMQVRLAFSIATRADTDILVLDEVLAVGDSNFQKKCSDYFENIKYKGRTVILVTHDMDSVERFCNRAMLLDKGKVISISDPAEITQQYSNLNFDVEKDRLEDQQKQQSHKDASNITMSSTIFVGSNKAKGIDANKDKKVRIELSVKSKIDIEKPTLAIIISNGAGVPIFATNTKTNKADFAIKKNTTTVVNIEVDNIFSNGEYTISTGIKSKDGSRIYYAKQDQDRFVVGGRKHDFALTSPDFKMEVTN